MGPPRQILQGRFNFDIQTHGDAVYAFENDWLTRITPRASERLFEVDELPWGYRLAPPLAWIGTRTSMLRGDLQTGKVVRVGRDDEHFEPGLELDSERVFRSRNDAGLAFELVSRSIEGSDEWSVLHRTEGAVDYRVEHVDAHDVFCTTARYHRLEQRDKHDGVLVAEYEVAPESRTGEVLPRWAFDEHTIYWSANNRIYSVPKREVTSSPYGRTRTRIEVKPRLVAALPGLVDWLAARDGRVFAMTRREPGWFDSDTHALVLLSKEAGKTRELFRVASKHSSVPFAVGREKVWLLVEQRSLRVQRWRTR